MIKYLLIMETKVCSECGKELPISEFHTWKRKDGTIGVLHQCLHCQRTKANRRHSDKKKFGEISKFETKVLTEELKRRDYRILLNEIKTKDMVLELNMRGFLVRKNKN